MFTPIRFARVVGKGGSAASIGLGTIRWIVREVAGRRQNPYPVADLFDLRNDGLVALGYVFAQGADLQR